MIFTFFCSFVFLFLLFAIRRRLRSHLKNSCFVLYHSKTIKALRLRPQAFISFLVFGNPLKHSHSCLKYYINYIYFCKCQKANEKKSKEDKQTLEELNSAHRHSQTKCQLVQTSYIKQSKWFLFLPYNKHLINRAKSVCMGESWPWSLYRPCSVCTYDLGQDSPIQTSCSVNKS